MEENKFFVHVIWRGTRKEIREVCNLLKEHGVCDAVVGDKR